MAAVLDVAAYILEQRGPMTAMKLQKLVYYAQAWHMVWDDELLFDERIEAWSNGPIVPALYEAHRGHFRLEPGHVEGSGAALTDHERESVDIVLRDLGHRSAHWLSELSHSERPWKEARQGVPPLERHGGEITPADMHLFYSGLCSKHE